MRMFFVFLPVGTPQLSTQTLSKGADGLIFATRAYSTTVYSLKVEPKYMAMGFPSIEKRDVPSYFIPVSNAFTYEFAQ
jgi:hypothetical protein